jgi:L-lactate permease
MLVAVGFQPMKAAAVALVANTAPVAFGAIAIPIVTLSGLTDIPKEVAIGAAAVGLAGREGDLFRKVLGWSLIMLLLMCVLVYLQSTSVLGWMVP